MSIERRIRELSLDLPPPFNATGLFRPLLVRGVLVYVAGHGPLLSRGAMMTGRIGMDLEIEDGVRAAQQTALSILSTLRHGLGDLDRIQRPGRS